MFFTILLFYCNKKVIINTKKTHNSECSIQLDKIKLKLANAKLFEIDSLFEKYSYYTNTLVVLDDNTDKKNLSFIVKNLLTLNKETTGICIYLNQCIYTNLLCSFKSNQFNINSMDYWDSEYLFYDDLEDDVLILEKIEKPPRRESIRLKLKNVLLLNK